MALQKKRYRDLQHRVYLYNGRLTTLLKKAVLRTTNVLSLKSMNSITRTSFVYTHTMRKFANSSITNIARLKNYCILSGHNRSVHAKKLGLSRMTIKALIENRKLPGFRKLSW